ncbi:MAG: 1-deoxy-D-xylulose-5-phosphate synthase [Bacteroidales bacterium]|nr:1-deoxy-D-xylulose-5-phosphate synthase [Bacteroidales bacterium]
MVSENKYNYLSDIQSPDDLRKISREDLAEVCKELREYIIEVLSNNSGHLASSLGAVEIAVAIHYIFNTPYDKVVWDVGHQAYAHKILTGRKDQFPDNRKWKGISGFPKMSESEFDAFGTGHSSTSIGAILGMAVASKLKGETDRHHIAVIGDGSIGGGMAFEALNHGGDLNTKMLVILNDNGIAIDESVGALREIFARMTASPHYNRFKGKVWKIFYNSKNFIAFLRHFFRGIKSTLTGTSNIFESLNWRYFGPIDGNNIEALCELLERLKEIPGPKLLHVITKKGKGLPIAEENPITYHAPGKFDKTTGDIILTPPSRHPEKYQDVFGHTIVELAEKNQKIVGITPAMPTGCSLSLMMDIMPHRAFDVGIAEQHAVTFAAGLASVGAIPFCNIYSSFMQRGYDQLIHDVALQKLPVVFCLDRSGLVGEDGPTHHGVFDLAFLRPIPNLTIAAPMNEIELRNMMFTAQLDGQGAFVIRYPRGRGVILDWKQPFESLEIGRGRQLREGSDIAVISIGHAGNFAEKACQQLEQENISIAHFDMRFLKPLDEQLLHKVFSNFKKVITVEDGTIIGGLGSAVMEFMTDHHYVAEIRRLGIPDHFIEQGTVDQLYHLCGYDAEGIVQTIKQMLQP